MKGKGKGCGKRKMGQAFKPIQNEVIPPLPEAPYPTASKKVVEPVQLASRDEAPTTSTSLATSTAQSCSAQRSASPALVSTFVFI